MKSIGHLVLAGVVLCASIAPASPLRASMGAAGQKQPFEENVGQYAEPIAFRMKLNGLEAAVHRDGGLRIAAPRRRSAKGGSVASLRLLNSSGPAAVRAEDPREHLTNYVGSDSQRNVVGVRHFGRVTFEEVYPGISLVYHATDSRLEYDFVVAPGADPRRIAIAISGAVASIAPSGDLDLMVDGASVLQRKPVAFQLIGAERVDVQAHYVLEQEELRIALGPYDREHRLIIDPVIEYASYLGGSSSDEARAVRVGSDGYLYIAGKTSSSNFPRVAAYDSTLGGTGDVFVTKVNPATGKIVYSTFIGGTADDEGLGLAVDSGGAVYVVGNAGAGFPTTTGAYQTGSVVAGFVSKLSAAGTALTYSTRVLGAKPMAVEVDASGQVVVTGHAGTAFIRTAGALQSTFGGAGGASDPMREGDAFVLKLNSGGTAAIFATYLGGGQKDYGQGITIDSSGRIVVAGTSESTNLPMVKSFRSTGPGGFLAALASNGASIVYSSYFGLTLTSIAADPYGNVVVAGTGDRTVPMVNAVMTAAQLMTVGFSTIKPFVAKFRLGTNLELAFSTYTGSTLDCCESAYGVAVDKLGDIHVVVNATIQYLDYLAARNPFLPKSFVVAKNNGFNSDVLVAAGYPRDGGRLLYQSMIAPCGEARSCRPPAIHANGAGTVLIAGMTASNWLPVSALNHQAAIVTNTDDAFAMTVNSENPSLALDVAIPAATPGVAFEVVARSYTVGATGSVTFWNGSTSLGSASLVEGVSRLSISLPAGVGRLNRLLKYSRT